MLALGTDDDDRMARLRAYEATSLRSSALPHWVWRAVQSPNRSRSPKREMKSARPCSVTPVSADAASGRLGTDQCRSSSVEPASPARRHRDLDARFANRVAGAFVLGIHCVGAAMRQLVGVSGSNRRCVQPAPRRRRPRRRRPTAVDAGLGLRGFEERLAGSAH